MVLRAASPEDRRIDGETPRRVVLADMSPLLRAMVRAIVNSADGLAIVGEVADSRRLVETTTELRADVLVVGDEEQFADAWHDALASVPRLRVVTVDDDGRHGSLHDAGPSSTLLLPLSAEKLVETIRGDDA
jgi:DNA-binding NarL/FixJ family response regulator